MSTNVFFVLLLVEQQVRHFCSTDLKHAAFLSGGRQPEVSCFPS